MENFFLNKNLLLRIKLFDMYHLFFVFLVIFFSLIVILNKNKIVKLDKITQKKIRILFGCLLLIILVIKNGSLIYYESFDWKKNLDLGFCNFTSVMFIIYCFTGSKKIYPICYLMTFIGPLISILGPSYDISPLNYNFYTFIIMHHLVFIFNLVFMFIENYKYDKKIFNKSVIFVLVYTILIYIFDFLTDSIYNNPLLFVNPKYRFTETINFLAYNYFTTILVFYFVVYILIYICKKTLVFLSENR